MSYVQRRISKKVIAGKSQIIFHVVISRGVKFRYKTGICILSRLQPRQSGQRTDRPFPVCLSQEPENLIVGKRRDSQWKNRLS